MTIELYRVNVPDDSLTTTESAAEHRQTTKRVLDGTRRIERLSGSPGDVDFRAQFRGKYAGLIANEVKELLESASIPIPLSRENDNINGYYSPSDDVSAPLDPRSNGLYRVRSGLSRVGTRKSHMLSVETSVSQPSPGHPFGNDADAIIGLPADATNIEIIDSENSPTERSKPSPVNTIETKNGSVDLYDASSESIDNSIYIYSVEYKAQGDVDPGVWDTTDNSTICDSDGIVSWGRVFDTAHDFTGDIVLENGLLRITIDEPTNADATASFQVETYDAAADSWSAVDLPSYADDDLDTDWQPADVDLTHIGQVRIRAQVEFEAVAGTNAGDVFTVDVELERGRSELEVWIPESVTAEIPPDLEALLEPIASTSIVETGATQGLVAREEVRL